jgi:hypothetical protein
MLALRSFPALALALTLAPALLAELPLPDVTLYGQLTTPAGAPVSAGSLTAHVTRGGAPVLTASGSFVQADGAAWYVVKVPLETSIGAPGPTGLAAREGDVVANVQLNGKTAQLKSAVPTLAAGLVVRADGTVDTNPVGSPYIRGDCSPDLTLNITDAVRVLNYLFIAPDPPSCLEACDSDGSGALNITDGIYLLSFLFLGGPAPPVPGPACAVDPSPSELGCEMTNCTV